jgi:hypothetical protein
MATSGHQVRLGAVTAIRQGGSASPLELSMAEVDSMALSYAVPVEDVLLIAVNLFGIRSGQDRHRARVSIRLRRAANVAWMVIVPLNASQSPFVLRGDELSLCGQVVGHVERVDADEAVGGYFRDGGRAATLNPNARSRCTGCAFCPNTLEAAADPRLAEERRLAELLTAMTEQHPRNDLTELQEITVSTGCFEREGAALDHLRSLRAALSARGITARVGFLTSVVRSREGLAEIARTVAPFVLRLTAECFTRRDLLLKASKADLSAAEMPRLLARARSVGLDTSFTYIVGLDPMPNLVRGVRALADHVTEFPNFQVYQAHNAIMARLRAPGADQVAFYLEARRAIEQIMEAGGLRPQAWECYRPLWYFTFGTHSLVDGSPQGSGA